MKQYLVIALLGFLLVPQANAQPAVLLTEYRFEVMPAGTGTSAPYYVNSLALSSASNMTYGSGLGLTGYTAGPNPNPDKAQWADNWSAGGYDANDYFGFTLTPLVGYTLVIDSITFRKRISSTGPRTQQFRSSANFYSSSLWISPADALTSWRKYSVTNPFPSSASAMTLRLYGYGSTGTTGTLRIDSLKVYGHLQDIYNLPVELLSFRGNAKEDHVALSWETATEHDNAFFTIERSIDFIAWQEVGIVPGAGHSLEDQEYGLADFHPEKGKNYYRLSQTDIDGTHEVLGTIAVMWQTEGNGLTRVLSICGNEIFGWSETHILHDLPPGIYLLQGEYETKKIVIP